MNKTELIAAMAETSGLSKKDCEAALAAFITTTESALKAGNKVQLEASALSRSKNVLPVLARILQQVSILISLHLRHLRSKQERLSKTPSSNLKTHREALTVLIRKCFFFS